MNNATERLYTALRDVFGDGAEFTAADVLTRLKLTGAPRIDELRAALESAISPKLGAIKIGKWFAAHRDLSAGGLRLTGDYDSDVKRWNWSVFKMATDAEIEQGLKRTAKEFRRQHAAAVRKGYNAEINFYDQLETKRAEAAAPAKDGRTAYHEREKQAREAEKQREAEKPAPRKYYLLTPIGASRFLHEPTALGVARQVRDLGYDAREVIAPGGGHLVQVWDVDRETAEALGKKLLRAVVDPAEQTRRPPQTQSMEYDAERDQYIPAGGPDLGYIPGKRALDRAMGIGQHTGQPAIKMQPMSSWSPFSDVPSCIRRRGSYANADAHEAYAKASRALTTYLNGRKQ